MWKDEKEEQKTMEAKKHQSEDENDSDNNEGQIKSEKRSVQTEKDASMKGNFEGGEKSNSSEEKQEEKDAKMQNQEEE